MNKYIIIYACLLSGCSSPHTSSTHTIYESNKTTGISLDRSGFLVGNNDKQTLSYPKDVNTNVSLDDKGSIVKLHSSPKDKRIINTNINNRYSSTVNHHTQNNIYRIDNSHRTQVNNKLDISKVNSDNTNTKVNSENADAQINSENKNGNGE